MFLLHQPPRSLERQVTLAERQPEQVVDMDNTAKSSRNRHMCPVLCLLSLEVGEDADICWGKEHQ